MARPLVLLVLLLTPTAAPGWAGPGGPADGVMPEAPADPRVALLHATQLAGLDPDRVRELGQPRHVAPDAGTAYLALLRALGSQEVTLDWTLPPALDAPLARLLAAVADAAVLQTEAVAALDESDHASLAALADAYRLSRGPAGRDALAEAWAAAPGLPPGLDRTRIAAAAYRLLDAALQTAPALRLAAASPAPLFPDRPLANGCLVDAPGLVALCGPDNDAIDGDHLLRIDLGGNDVHRGNSGSSGLNVLWPSTNGLPVALLIDVAGHDTYEGSAQAQGTGSTTPGVLVDLEGNDVYRSDALFFNFVQGAGNLGGVGILHDALGSDLYLTPAGRTGGQTAWDSQGFGILMGIGILHDASGSDGYVGGAMAQGVGDFQAVGALIDVDGYDAYDGVRLAQGFADGGAIGLLWEGAGSDHYLARESRAQAAAVGGNAALLDLDGDDTYVAAGDAQGWGVHGVAWQPVNAVLAALGLSLPGAAVLLDGSGTDSYSGAGCNGCAWSHGTSGLGLDTF